MLGKSNKEILQQFGGNGAQEYEILVLPISPSDVEVKMLNDDWGTATVFIDGNRTESVLLNLA